MYKLPSTIIMMSAVGTSIMKEDIDTGTIQYGTQNEDLIHCNLYSNFSSCHHTAASDFSKNPND